MPQLVKDFKGNLIPKDKARRIRNEAGKQEYFEEGVSCILMPDGKWYRTTTGKILYDHSLEQWVFLGNFVGTKGLVADGSFGCFSNQSKVVPIKFKKEGFSKKTIFDPLSKQLEDSEFKDTRWNASVAMSEEIALRHGYVESIFDGIFWKLSDCNSEERARLTQYNIPAHERTNTYSLDDDRHYREVLEKAYDENDLNIPINLKRFARKYIPFSFGIEWEVQNGHLPKRIREPLGVRACRDGSLGEGIEYVSVPMQGGKGLAISRKVCEELTKRCEISQRCSVHVHFGGVRKDKLYVVSLWNLLAKIQAEFRRYFPYSRTHQLTEGAKIYASLLPDVKLDVSNLLGIKTDEAFKKALITEFNKIYSWLNSGHPLGEQYDEEFVKETKEQIINGKSQEFFCYRVKNHKFTTKLPRHAIQGRKWERPTRYVFCNFLNVFFSHSHTTEFRIHEASTNFDKILLYISLCVAILKYAENFKESLSDKPVTIKDILRDHFSFKVADAIMEYLHERETTFCTKAKTFRTNWKDLEQDWLNADKNYKTVKIYDL